MKRSTTIALIGLGAGAVTFYALTGEGERTREAHVYETQRDCTLAGNATELCQREFAEALAEHQRTAPRYEGRQDCEEQYGQGACEARNVGGATVFSPIFAGAMFAAVAAGARNVVTQPVYRAPLAGGPPPPMVCPPNVPQPCPPDQMRPQQSYQTSGGVRFSIVDWRGWNTSTQTTASRTPQTVAVPRSATDAPPRRPQTIPFGTSVQRQGFGTIGRSIGNSQRSVGT